MSYEPAGTELKQLIDRWVAQWNEPGPDGRRRLIREVWAEDGYQIMVNPPQGIRETAAHYRVPFPSIEIRGHDAIYARVTRDSGSIAGSGLEVLTFGPDGRVRTDHQFVA